MAVTLGGESVLYVATAMSEGDSELERRVSAHRERRPPGWGTLEIGGGRLEAVIEASERWETVLFDSVTLWASARMFGEGGEDASLGEFEAFLDRVESLRTPMILVSDEVGLGVVPESVAGRRFQDLLGLVNQRAAAAAEEVYFCVAGLEQRIK
jgi:adenosylcobinamide kinase/adenosylcobinamide-phosphate guanylyltransferase